MSDERQQIGEPSALVPDRTSPSQEVIFGSLAQDQELVRDFLVEARDHLNAVESGVLVLEQTPGKLDAIHSIFRGFHTIKGLAGFLEFAAMQEVAHETENLLDLARNGKLTVTPEVIDAVLAGADFLAKWLDRIEAALGGGPVPAEPPSEALRARIQAMAAAPGEGGPVARLAAAVEQPPEVEAAPAEAATSRPIASRRRSRPRPFLLRSKNLPAPSWRRRRRFPTPFRSRWPRPFRRRSPGARGKRTRRRGAKPIPSW